MTEPHPADRAPRTHRWLTSLTPDTLLERFRSRALRASLLSVGVDLLLVAIKGTLAWVTGSLALAADAYHSLTDMVVSLGVMAGMLISRAVPAPTSATAAVGRPRLESGLALLVALLILTLPIEILSEARVEQTQEIRHAWAGILGMLACIAIAYFASRFKLLIGQDEASPALVADGQHSRVDMFSSLAVLLSLLGQYIGIDLDALVAVIIAVLIGLTGVDLLLVACLGLSSVAKPCPRRAPNEPSAWPRRRPRRSNGVCAPPATRPSSRRPRAPIGWRPT